MEKRGAIQGMIGLTKVLQQKKALEPPVNYGSLDNPLVLKNVYAEPQCQDTAVCMVYYSAVGYVRPRMNFLFVEQGLRAAKIPLFTAECVIGDQPPFLLNPTLRKHSKSALFFKEQLFNHLEPLIPEQYTKLIFIDGDVLFDQADWVDAVSKKLDTCDVLQPFAHAKWLDMNYKRFQRENVFGFAKGILDHKWLSSVQYMHPGFAWAMTRSFFKSIGGFYDRMIVGSGDSAFVHAFVDIPDVYTRPSEEWLQRIRSLNPRLGYTLGNIYHLGHGHYTQRQYTQRHRLFPGGKPAVHLNEEGMYEVDNPKDNEILLEYFRSRGEDQT